MNDAFAIGCYSFSEAARLTGLRPQRIREWFVGRGSDPRRRPVFHSDYEPIGDTHAISFLDLVEVYVAGYMRNFGVSLPKVRNVHARMKSDFGTTHPFARHELLTNGKEIFVRSFDKSGESAIVEVLTKQRAFPQLLSFFQRIDYDQLSALAKRWRISDGVVVDPRFSFGKPILESRSIPTYLVAAEYRANHRNADRVATWYGISSDDVMRAVKFEAGLAV